MSGEIATEDLVRRVTDLARIRLADGDVRALDDPDADLAAAGLGSIAIVEFMVDLERTFAVTFPAEMINGETFRTVRTVVDALRRLRER